MFKSIKGRAQKSQIKLLFLILSLVSSTSSPGLSKSFIVQLGGLGKRADKVSATLLSASPTLL
jgi:hypothetical protein